LLAKPTQLNINFGSDCFAMFNKQRDITSRFKQNCSDLREQKFRGVAHTEKL
jgi:hypothetical protein